MLRIIYKIVDGKSTKPNPLRIKHSLFIVFVFNFSFAVEVADFNFGETASVDVEYKTFHQRLFDSIRTLVRRPSNSDASGGSESSLKYGSMT